MAPIPAAIQWPQVTLACGEKLTFRYSYAADYQIQIWKKNLDTANWMEVAAAMAGEFTAPGKWRSRGFERPLDLVDILENEDILPIMEATEKALKNRYPELELSARPVPGKGETETTSDCGPSLQATPALDSPTSNSGG